MIYNCRIEIERVNQCFISTVEISSFGRARRKRISSETFDKCLADIKATHDEMRAECEAFNNPAPNMPAVVVGALPAEADRFETIIIDAETRSAPKPDDFMHMKTNEKRANKVIKPTKKAKAKRRAA